MAWQGLEGHDDVVERFRALLARGRLAHTFLFVGPPGIGKRSFALRFAAALLCQRRPAAELDPCGQCPSCLQIAAGTHPDLLLVSKPADKSSIPLELFIGPKEKRMQQGLCHDISLKPFMGGRRVAIIDDADYLNEEGANSLLKTLEEPPAQSVLILIGTSADRQLPTIRSRAQMVRFRPLRTEVVAAQLVARGVVDDSSSALRLAAFSGGSITHAAELADPDLWKFRDVLFAQLGERSFDGVTFAKTLAAFVDEAGKEAPLRRARMRLVIGFAIEFYRELLREVFGVTSGGATPHEEITRTAASGRFAGVDLAALVERSIEALGHVDRNAHQAALLECWLDDLVQLSQPSGATA